MHSFLRAVKTNYHKLDGLRSQTFCLSQFWGQKLETQLSTRPCSLKALGSMFPCLFQPVVVAGHPR